MSVGSPFSMAAPRTVPGRLLYISFRRAPIEMSNLVRSTEPISIAHIRADVVYSLSDNGLSILAPCLINISHTLVFLASRARSNSVHPPQPSAMPMSTPASSSSLTIEESSLRDLATARAKGETYGNPSVSGLTSGQACNRASIISTFAIWAASPSTVVSPKSSSKSMSTKAFTSAPLLSRRMIISRFPPGTAAANALGPCHPLRALTSVSGPRNSWERLGSVMLPAASARHNGDTWAP
ncbi:hypothetical protein BDV06DRAFT_195168 [Aspergillus oleicola]